NQGRSAVGFLMATFGKLASSSREALKSALQRRVDVLRGTQTELEGRDGEVPDENAAAAVGGATAKGKKGKQSLISGEAKLLDGRKEVVRRFNERDQPRFIVSTAAGGEGLNLQRRCHTIVNYDLPWNPNVLQQRIGRVYRYGQTKPVIVYNLRVETDNDAYAD